MNAPTASPDLVRTLVLRPLGNAKSQMVLSGKTLNGVMALFTRLGDADSANLMASCIYELADAVQVIGALIEKLEAEAGS